MRTIADLDAIIKDIVDIDGISMGDKDDKNTWRVAYKTDPTFDELALVNAAIESFSIMSSAEEDAAKYKKAQITEGDSVVLKHLECIAAGVASDLSSDEFLSLVQRRNLLRADIGE